MPLDVLIVVFVLGVFSSRLHYLRLHHSDSRRTALIWIPQEWYSLEGGSVVFLQSTCCTLCKAMYYCIFICRPVSPTHLCQPIISLYVLKSARKLVYAVIRRELLRGPRLAISLDCTLLLIAHFIARGE